MSRDCLWF
jgi:hypothetical protein